MGVKEKLGVEGRILLPWKTLGLVGLGPKAQKHSQNSETCYTYDLACKEGRSCCASGITLLEKKKKNYPIS